MEDVWLQTKNFITTFYYLCSSFKIVKWLFKFFADGQIFDFPKLFQYGILPQPPRGLLYMQTMGIEAMLKDYKAGSYNLEAAKTN